MKSKKLAALGLTAVLSLGLLTACSGGSDDTNETPAGSTPPVTCLLYTSPSPRDRG